MQPEGTYQLIEALGSCQVGTVWSAVDNLGRSLTVAVLDPAAAADHRWREAFASTANALGSGAAGGVQVVSADYSATAPWAACVAGDGPGAEQIFIALGMEYHPAPFTTGADAFPAATAADSSAQPDHPAPPPDHPALPPDQSVVQSPTVGLQPASPPAIPAPAEPGPVSAAPSPESAPPAPVSGAPQSPVAGPQPPTFDPLPPDSDAPQWTGWSTEQAADLPEISYTYDQGYPPLEASKVDAPRRRTRLWIGVAAAVVVALGAGGGIYAWQSGGGTPEATGSASSSPPPVVEPTASPLQPGKEPPKEGSWPGWPRFGAADHAQTLRLSGLAFPLIVPTTWKCTNSELADGYAKFQCGDDAHPDLQIGGELVVRDCPEPCDDNRRATLRKAEEAWGLQWRKAGQFAFIAETRKLNGAPRYGLVLVAFFRSKADGAIDQELVFRATSPVASLETLQKVANSIRGRSGF